MDKTHSTLMEALKVVPDPRKARGQRYPWVLLLTLLGGAVSSGQRTVHTMADWVRLHAVELIEALQVSRALRTIDLAWLEQPVSRFVDGLAA